jgi:hypothetical protein
LQAGVAPDTAGTIGGDRPVSGYISNAGNISVNGQRETANAFLVNGGDVSEGRNLGAGLVPNLDSVEEFRLITNSFDAEYGKFSGAVMNAITKSGTNGFHGDVFEFWRNDKMDSVSYFNSAKSELRRHQFGGVAGGPFWKDKLFWFTDFQGTRQLAGAETGVVSLPNAAERLGNFDPSLFVQAATVNGISTFVPTTVDGGPNPAGCQTPPCTDWPSRLTARLQPITGQTISAGEPYAMLEVPDSSAVGFLWELSHIFRRRTWIPSRARTQTIARRVGSTISRLESESTLTTTRRATGLSITTSTIRLPTTPCRQRACQAFPRRHQPGRKSLS